MNFSLSLNKQNPQSKVSPWINSLFSLFLYLFRLEEVRSKIVIKIEKYIHIISYIFSKFSFQRRKVREDRNKTKMINCCFHK